MEHVIPLSFVGDTKHEGDGVPQSSFYDLKCREGPCPSSDGSTVPAREKEVTGPGAIARGYIVLGHAGAGVL